MIRVFVPDEDCQGAEKAKAVSETAPSATAAARSVRLSVLKKRQTCEI